jgi:hypothetical protein
MSKGQGDRSGRPGYAFTPAPRLRSGQSDQAFAVAFNVQAKAWTYPKSNSEGQNNSNATAKAKSGELREVDVVPPPFANCCEGWGTRAVGVVWKRTGTGRAKTWSESRLEGEPSGELEGSGVGTGEV